jgi:hypothetical protein
MHESYTHNNNVYIVTCWRYLVPLRHVFTLLITSEHQMQRVGLLKTPFGMLHFFTTPLVVTTVSVYNVLGPSDVVFRSGPGSSLEDLPWSASLISLLCLSLLCVSSLLFSVCPFICCPSNSVFAPRIEDTFPHGFISRCCGFQQSGCLGILSRWVATLISNVPCISKVVA